MQELTKENLNRILSIHNSSQCISLYIPLSTDISESDKNRIKYKNAIDSAIDSLNDDYIHLEDFVKNINQAKDFNSTKQFSDPKSKGLVVFISDKVFEVFTLSTKFPNISFVGNYFYIKPIFEHFNIQEEFYVLALSKNENKLLRIYEDNCQEIFIKNMPESLSDALDFIRDGALELKSTLKSRGVSMQFNASNASRTDKSLADFRSYLRLIVKNLKEYFQDRRIKILLATTEENQVYFKEEAEDLVLMESYLKGNFENISNEEICKKAMEVLRENVKEHKKVIMENLNNIKGTSQASIDLEEIIKASIEGKIYRLLLLKDGMIWGKYNPKTDSVEIHQERQKESVELLDFLCRNVFSNSGEIYILNNDDYERFLPQKVGAIYRY